MKYGESTFDILYLILAITCGLIMLSRAKDRVGKLMGLATLILGLGDAFHLVPRVLNYFTDWDLTAALGVGKFVTSITMTVFYMIMYYIWIRLYGEEPNRKLTVCMWVLFLARVVLCLFPQNGWLSNESDVTWGILRNLPFVAIGIIIVVLFFGKKDQIRHFRFVWLYVTLSFLFYIPVAVGAGLVPMLGMLMLPKTICYIFLVITFFRFVKRNGKTAVNGATE